MIVLNNFELTVTDFAWVELNRVKRLFKTSFILFVNVNLYIYVIM